MLDQSNGGKLTDLGVKVELGVVGGRPVLENILSKRTADPTLPSDKFHAASPLRSFDQLIRFDLLFHL